MYELSSPIPPLIDPTVRFVAEADTADQIIAAAVTRSWKNPRSLIALTAIAVGLVLCATAFGGAAGFGGGLFAVAVMSIVLVRSTARSKVTARARMSRWIYPGAVLATRFGADAVDVQSPTFHIRLFYDAMTAITVTEDAVIIRSDSPLYQAFPRALFPDAELAHMRSPRSSQQSRSMP